MVTMNIGSNIDPLREKLVKYTAASVNPGTDAQLLSNMRLRIDTINALAAIDTMSVYQL